MEYTHSQLLKTQRKIRISLKEHCNVTNYDLGKHAAKVANHHVLKPCTIQRVIFRITKIMKCKQSLFTVRISFKCYRFSHSPYQVLADKIEGETHNRKQISRQQRTYHVTLQGIIYQPGVAREEPLSTQDSRALTRLTPKFFKPFFKPFLAFCLPKRV